MDNSEHKKIIRKLLVETKIIFSALEAKDIDIVQSSLKVKAQLFRDYESLPNAALEEDMRAMLKEVQRIDDKNKLLLKALQVENREEARLNKVRMKEVKFKSNVRNQYIGNVSSSGNIFDLKK